MLDLKEAFYRLMRCMVVGNPVPDEEIAAFLHRLGLPADSLENLRAHVTEPAAMVRGKVPPFLQRVAWALHEDTHFWVDDAPALCHTTHSWADVLFG